MEVVAKKVIFPKYPSYKDSGEYWMGAIPEHWEIRKLKHVFKEKKKVTNPSLNCGSISFGKVIYKDDEKVPESTKASYQEVLAGEYLVNPLNLNYDLISLRIGLSDINVVVSSGYIVLKNTIELDKSYFNYLLHRYDVAYMKLLGSGVRQTISFNHIANSLLAYPPKEEQTAIAKFLDDKTAKIDRAIAQKEQLIALLKERKQIIIQNAVTKGLDPNVKLKDSGVEWIGEIPEGWKVEKLFGVCRFVRGNSTFGKDELLSKGEYVALQYGKTYKVNEVDEKFEFYVNNEFYKDSQIVNYGDTIFISTSETIEDLGHTAFYKRNDLGLLGGEQMLLKPKSDTVNSKYLHFSAKVFSKELRKYATGIKVFRFNINDLKTIYTPVPPIDDQNKIVQHIELQLKKTDQAISLQQTQIEKLKEYKATLIDSAVMGKIKVS
jgi:type I restriction enzyme, S subunit